MQAEGAAQGVGTTSPRRGGRLEVVMAIASIAVIAVVMALLVWAGPLTTGGAETANPGAASFSGSVVIHDDPGNVHRTWMPQGARY